MSYALRRPYYDGKVQNSDGPIFHSLNPLNGEVLAQVTAADSAVIDAAVSSASAAFTSWSKISPAERSRILLRAQKLLRERNDEIACVETDDTGKPFSETSTVDVVSGADVLEFFASLVASGGLNGETIQMRRDAYIQTTKEPLGACVGIGAWNYPIQM